MRKAPNRKGTLTLEKILVKSAWLFNRSGYHTTSLADIARAFGVTKAALYHHVRSKDDIVFACYQRAMDIGMEGLRQAESSASAPHEQLLIALRHYIEGLTDELSGAVVLIDKATLSANQRAEIIERRDAYERALRSIIERGVTSGVFVACDAKMVGFAILGAVNWISKWYDPAGSWSGKEIAQEFASYLVRGLTGSNELTPPPMAR
jgi:AcrR family transcriptional regulator